MGDILEGGRWERRRRGVRPRYQGRSGIASAFAKTAVCLRTPITRSNLRKIFGECLFPENDCEMPPLNYNWGSLLPAIALCLLRRIRLPRGFLDAQVVFGP